MVLIVAKCNVNLWYILPSVTIFNVLIVAKCNVNDNLFAILISVLTVLIVAKCNVNCFTNRKSSKKTMGINSSKV